MSLAAVRCIAREQRRLLLYPVGAGLSRGSRLRGAQADGIGFASPTVFTPRTSPSQSKLLHPKHQAR